MKTLPTLLLGLASLSVCAFADESWPATNEGSNPSRTSVPAVTAEQIDAMIQKQYQDALAMISSGEKEEMDQGIATLQQMSDEGYLTATDALAYCYMMGIGVQRNDKQGFDLYTKASEANHISSISSLAECYLKGLGTEKNIAYAQHLYIKAFKMGDTKTASIVGDIYSKGLYGVHDNIAAVAWYKLGYEVGDPTASCQWALALNAGNGTDKDEKAAYDIFKKLAEENNHAYSWGQLGLYHWAGKTVPQDKEYAIKCFRKGAAAGGKESRRYLAYAYRDGNEVEKQPATALSMLHSLAYEGDSVAQFDAGQMLKSGDGVEQDLEEAYKLFNMAAHENYIPACMEVALAKFLGQGCKVDYEGAVKLFAQCEATGRGDAALMLVKCHREGKGFPAEPEVAHAMLLDLLNKNCFGAAFELGLDYELGRGVEANAEKAQEYYQKADAQGDSRAALKLGIRN